jgi:DNA-binding response OmpR family regulator
MENKILIIDDDEHVLATLRKMLERERYKVVVVPDGEAGLKFYRENSADLIIIDLLMPRRGGIDTIVELCAEFPNVKIIAISGGGRVAAKDHLVVAKQFGAQYTFAKPVERKELLEAVQDLLK